MKVRIRSVSDRGKERGLVWVGGCGGRKQLLVKGKGVSDGEGGKEVLVHIGGR